MGDGANALKPRCALRIGVVGNRKFGAAVMRQHAENALAAIWQTLLASIEQVLDDPMLDMRALYSSAPPRVAVLSSLAAGSDQIGAQTALDARTGHERISIELELMLPFREEFYPGTDIVRPEFTSDDVKAFHALVHEARQIVQLDGDYSNDETRMHAYQQVRDLLLQNSDLLIAIYDPAAEAKRAGTVETARLAMQGNTPVIAVLLQPTEARIAIHARQSDIAPRADAQWNAASAIDADSWRSKLFERVREQLVLPEALHGHAEALEESRRRLRLMSDEEPLS